MKTSTEVMKKILGSDFAQSTTKDERTKLFLERWRGESGEWNALWGVMELPGPWDAKSRKLFERLVNTDAVAKRLDELRGAILVDSKKLLDAKPAPFSDAEHNADMAAVFGGPTKGVTILTRANHSAGTKFTLTVEGRDDNDGEDCVAPAGMVWEIREVNHYPEQDPIASYSVVAANGCWNHLDHAELPGLGFTIVKACPKCGRADVATRPDGELTLHDDPAGVACNLPGFTAQKGA